MSFYAARIAAMTDRDPRHVEAWMRVAHGTLDHFDPAGFKREVRIAEECVREAGPEESEQLARSYGL